MARGQRFQMQDGQNIQPSRDPDYKQSRAAQRQMYGTRRIDASTKQSALDNTPSGRMARYKQDGMTQGQAENADEAYWRRPSVFGPKTQPEDFAGNIRPIEGGGKMVPLGTPDPSISQPQVLSRKTDYATPEDILQAYENGQTSGSFALPNGGSASFGVVPSSQLPASAMSSFLPSTKRNGYMSSVLDSASRWTKPF